MKSIFGIAFLSVMLQMSCNPDSEILLQYQAVFDRAEQNARLANEAFQRCHRFTEGWLKYADPASGVIPRNLTQDKDIWNARDSAADNYPFMVLTAAITDSALFAGKMLEMLRSEARLTSATGGFSERLSGGALLAGIPLKLTPDTTVQIILNPR